VNGWFVRLDCPAGQVAELARLLDAAEHDRAGRLAAAPRRRFVVAHAVLRIVVGRAAGVAPGAVRWRFGPLGKPEPDIPGPTLHVNLSTSVDLALIGISSAGPIGVDVERVDHAAPVVRRAARFFPPADRATVLAAPPASAAAVYFALWVRKEAWAKAQGLGVIDGLKVPTSSADDPVCAITTLPAPPGFAAASAGLRQPADGTADECRIVGQDRPLQPLQIRTWLDAEFGEQHGPGAAEDFQRVTTPLRPVEREHVHTAEFFP
jgi:4'-phosphopantetheinyl transferase